MLKRNEGYALSYVLVVLLVLCAIAVTVMTVSLNNLKNQQAAIDRMTEKYEAQGLVEQVVAQLENGTNLNDIKRNLPSEVTLSEDEFPNDEGIYSIEAVSGNCVVTAKFRVSSVVNGETEAYNKVEYISYGVSYTPSNEGGGE